ncbi:MAG: potassium channel protein [bacterium]|nr:potassium channel protein [bacterium]
MIATVGYYLLNPERSWLDALYMTVTSITTVGLREVYPVSDAGMTWTLIVITGGLVTGTVAMSMIVAMIVEGQVRTIFGRRQLQRKIASLSGHVILCGYGRLGGRVTDELVSAGKKVVIIDSSDAQTQAAESVGLLYVLGNAETDDVLKAAGVERADVIVTTLPTDAENVFVTLSAREINPNLRIIAAAREISTQDKLIKAGADRVVCAHTLGASRMAAVVLRPAVVDFVEMSGQGGEIAMDQIKLDSGSKLVGKSLKELELPHRVGVHICAIQRGSAEMLYQPAPDFVLAAGDILVLIGPSGAVSAVEAMVPGS